MTKILNFTIEFHGPFAINTGSASGGLDRRVDLEAPIPASSLKGLMRAEALHRLGVPQHRVNEIFGSQQQQASPWMWSNAICDEGLSVGIWSRIKVDDLGRSQERALMIGEQVWADQATFTITQKDALPPSQEVTEHVLVLRAAARHIASLGSHRRRGQGWVSIFDHESWTDGDSQTLLSLVGEQPR